MSETDRLAALLHAEWDWYLACEPSEPVAPCNDCLASATRLIAAGVTLDTRPAPDAALDVGRLAVAMRDMCDCIRSDRDAALWARDIALAYEATER